MLVNTLWKVLETFAHNWIFLLLSVGISVWLKLYINQEMVARFMQKYRRGSVVMATAAAVGTPLCSCGTTAVVLGMVASVMPWAPAAASLIEEKMPDGSAEAEDMDLVIRETKRCASIIRRLLDFARRKTPEMKFTNLNAMIEDVVRFIDRAAQLQDTAIEIDLDPGLPCVWIDEDQMKQVVMNMLVNAQHATERGGSIAIRSRLCRAPAGPAPGRRRRAPCRPSPWSGARSRRCSVAAASSAARRPSRPWPRSCCRSRSRRARGS